MTNIKLRSRILILMVVTASILLASNFSTDRASTKLNDSASASASMINMESSEAFDKMMAVLTHKRCVNCHPAGDRPHQGEDSHVHNFNVQRGPENHGQGSLTCNTCHREENNNYSGVPGAPEWSLAPRKMAWEGLSRVEIAKSILNPEINGGRNLAATVKHLTEHELVLWAWAPGVDSEGNEREKPPVSKEEYIAAVKAWAAAGAPIPEE